MTRSAATRPVSALDWRGSDGAPAGTLVIRGARVFDPLEGVDDPLDVVVREGQIAELAQPGSADADGAELIEAEGLALFPAFFDPHVHLRTPGHEDKEDVETGSRAAAAGGFCGIVGMANTVPPIDTAADVSALREQARERGAVPVGFVATVTKGMAGAELTEMADLAAAGAVGFSDDGLPIRSARVMRRALQYQRLVDLPIALHEEDPELSAGGSMHEGEVSAALGIAGVPSVSESTMIARDCALAAYEEARIHVQHLSAAESVVAIERAKAAGDRGHLRGDAAPPHAHRRGGQEPRLALQDEPAAAHRGRPPGAVGRRSLRCHRLHRDGPRPAHLRREGDPVRAGGDGSHRARDRVRRALHRPRDPGRPRAGHAGRAPGRRRRATGLSPAPDRQGGRGQPDPLRPRRRVGGRGGGLGEPLGQLLLLRAAPAQPGADHRRLRRVAYRQRSFAWGSPHERRRLPVLDGWRSCRGAHN